MKQIAAIILENDAGEILLYLRDNKPGLPFPHHWDLFGGHVEAGETPEEALVREVQEELGLNLTDYQFFRRYDCLEGDANPNVKFVYSGKINLPLDELVLYEGERLNYFRRDQLADLKFANILKTIVMDYVDSTEK